MDVLDGRPPDVKGATLPSLRQNSRASERGRESCETNCREILMRASSVCSMGDGRAEMDEEKRGRNTNDKSISDWIYQIIS